MESAKKAGSVGIALERLQNLATQSEELAEEVRATFRSVLLNKPIKNEEISHSEKAPEKPPSCDIAISMIEVADKLADSFGRIKIVIDMADVG